MFLINGANITWIWISVFFTVSFPTFLQVLLRNISLPVSRMQLLLSLKKQQQPLPRMPPRPGPIPQHPSFHQNSHCPRMSTIFLPLVHILAHGFLLPASMPVLTHHDQPHQFLPPLSSICCYGVLRSHDSTFSIMSHLSSIQYSISISSPFTPCHGLTTSYETVNMGILTSHTKKTS